MGRMSKRSLAMKEAWARRKAAAQTTESTEKTTETRTVRKSSIELSKNVFTIEQIRELGFYGVTSDGQNYRLVMQEGRPVQ